MKSRIIAATAIIFWGLVFASCSPFERMVFHLAEPGGSVEPTSVLLKYRTPRPSATPYLPTPTMTLTPNLDPDDYFGGMVVTMDEVGQTIPLRLSQNFLLSLGAEYVWSITIEPPEVVSQNVKITPLPGEQGVFIARRRGEAVLQAVGEPACRRSQPPCERPSILFQVTIVVE